MPDGFIRQTTYDALQLGPELDDLKAQFHSNLFTTTNLFQRISTMSAQAVKAAGQAASKATQGSVLKKGAKRDPELYVRSMNNYPSPLKLLTAFLCTIFLLTSASL